MNLPGKTAWTESNTALVAWAWVQRLGATLVIPTLGVAILTWADFRAHMNWEPQHQEAHEGIRSFMAQGDRYVMSDALRMEADIKAWVENKFPTNVQYAYLMERINDLQGDIAEIKTLLKEK